MRSLAVLIVLAAVTLDSPASMAAEPGSAEPLAVHAEPVRRVELRETVRAYGRVDQRPQFLYFEIPGYLETLAADVGDTVTAGQVLARLDSGEVDNDLRRAREDLVHAQTEYDRVRQLASSQTASRTQLEAHRHAVEQRRITLDRLLDHRARHELRAPMAGRVIDRLVDFAGPVTAGSPVFRLHDAAEPLRVSAELSQDEIRRVAIGDTARATLPEAPEVVLPGRLEKIYPAGETGLFEVDIALEAAPKGITLHSGMQIDVDVETAGRHRGFAVSVNALLSVDDDGAAHTTGRIFVVSDGRAKALTVGLSGLDGSRVLVKDDLSLYDGVIVQGQHRLVDGAAVVVR